MEYKYSLKTNPGYVVAFLDIIAFSNMIIANDEVKDGDHGFIYNFDIIYKNIVEYFSEEYQKNEEITFLWVSDSIFLTAKVEKIANLITAMNNVIQWIYCAGLSVRGGISIGSLYNNGNIWGKAVVEAVNLEKKAKYPRIIISADDLGTLNDYIELLYWVQDGNYFYYDYFQYLVDERKQRKADIHSDLSVFANLIKDNFQKCVEENHKEKWHFLATELERTIKNNSDYIDTHCVQEKFMVTDPDISNQSASNIFLARLFDAIYFENISEENDNGTHEI